LLAEILAVITTVRKSDDCTVASTSLSFSIDVLVFGELKGDILGEMVYELEDTAYMFLL